MSGILGVTITLLACFGIFLATLILVVARPKWRVFLKPFLLGTATFLIFQVFTRIPLLQNVLPGQIWFVMLKQTHPVWFIILIGGVTAGLFEEFGRFAMMHAIRPEKRTTAAAIAFGIGHGGIEAVLVGLPSLQSILPVLVLIPDLPFSSLAITGVERILAIAFHVGASVLVMSAVRNRLWWLVLIAIALHTACNSASVLTGLYGGSPWLGEATMAPISAAMLIYTIVMFRLEKKKEVLP